MVNQASRKKQTSSLAAAAGAQETTARKEKQPPHILPDTTNPNGKETTKAKASEPKMSPD
jgi:hypothetical protein